MKHQSFNTYKENTDRIRKKKLFYNNSWRPQYCTFNNGQKQQREDQ